MSSDVNRIARYYDDLARRFGADPRSADAQSNEGLRVRYEALCAVEDLSGLTVLEVGCGVGFLGEHIRTHFPDARYRGIDVSGEAIRVGREAHPELALEHRDLADLSSPDDEADVVLAQGVFYLLGSGAEEKMEGMIDRMWRLARRAVAFSAISAWGQSPADGEFRVDPIRLLDVCRKLTTRQVLRHDYHPGDVTMYLYRR